MQSTITSFIRTYVPVAVGSLLSFLLVKFGLELDAETTTNLTAALTGVVIGVYYLVARTLEKKWPQVGTILLGSSKQPVYREVK